MFADGQSRRSRTWLTKLRRSVRANVSTVFALSLIPLGVAIGGGVDLARCAVVRANLANALDAAGLAVGATSGLTQQQIQALAQQYFTANYTTSTAFGLPNAVTAVTGTNGTGGNTLSLSDTVPVPTTLMRLVGITTVNVSYTSTVVWGQTKLWVGLVLDNTLSMCEPDTPPNCTSASKIGALKTAITGSDGQSDSDGLLYILKNAAANPGDVKVALIPFTKDVRLPASIYGQANVVDFTDFNSAPPGSMPDATIHTGSNCPYVTNTVGYACASGPTNGSATTNLIPGTCTVNGVNYSGCICPSMVTGESGGYYIGQFLHYYNGCYDSVPVVGSPGSYTHTWHANSTSTWDDCVMDRTQDYDVSNAAPSGTATAFPAENNVACPAAALAGLSYDWTSLTSEVNAMEPAGTTNQPIGLVWGWQAMSQGAPFNPGPLPNYTSRIIILLSDGLNTEDRWYTGGILPPPEYMADATDVDARMNLVCNAVKADGVTVYSIYVDLNGTQGNSQVLQSCASDSTKYFDLTSAGQIITTLNAIATQITQLRVSQ